jgi:hypothetical protein
MGRLYTLPWTGALETASGNIDLWEVLPADDKPIRIRGVRLGQTSELGDAAEETLLLAFIRLAATVTSGNGTAFTSTTAPRPCDDANAQAAGFSAEYNAASVGTSTTDIGIIEYLPWNIRQTPFEVWYPDDMFAPSCRQGSAIVLRLMAAVTDSITFAGTMWVEEI